MEKLLLSHSSAAIVDDWGGEYYEIVLRRLHGLLKPKSYLEIGVAKGYALRHAQCCSIAIDPHFDFDDIRIIREIMRKPTLQLFQMTSDDFFQNLSPEILLGRKIDMAFLDGMHRCEYLLRDFMNVERFCKKNSVVALHDCLPVEIGMTSRTPGTEKAIAPHREGWWTGDVWRTSLLLKRRRPDLAMTALDSSPTGLILITNLNPADTRLAENYKEYVDDMFSWDLSEIGWENYFAEMNVVSSATLASAEDITRRFWL